MYREKVMHWFISVNEKENKNINLNFACLDRKADISNVNSYYYNTVFDYLFTY